MKRRVALKQILVATAAAAILPSCLSDRKKKEKIILSKNSSLTENQQETVFAVAETIIPETDIVGAKSIGAHLFVLTMVRDCYDKATQDTFAKGLDELNAHTDKLYGNPFSECTANEQEEILREVESKKIPSPDLQKFYELTKRHTVQAFMSCEYVMTQIKGYEFVPGRFNGCVQVKTAS